MNRRAAIKLVLLAALPCSLLGAGATSRPANPDTTIQVTAAVGSFDESSDGKREPSPITLELIGQPMNRAIAYANFRIEEAIDDAGEDLADSDDPVLQSNTHIQDPQHFCRPDGTPAIDR